MTNLFNYRAVYIQRDELVTVRDKLLDSEFKGALLSSEEHTAYLNALVFPNQHFRYAPEIVSVFNLCIYLHRQSCIAQEINLNILNFKSNGLLQAWEKEFVDRSYLVERKIVEPKVLKIEQLLGAYELLAIGLSLSFSVFLIELCSSKLSCMRRIMSNL